jgi:hypothetical protein
MNKVARHFYVAVILLAMNTSVSAQPSVLQCFYECKLDFTGARFAEVTTLMITNENQPPIPGDHSNLHDATAVFLDGRENVIAQSQTLLSGRDLDELNVCATMQRAGIFPPSAGLIQIAIRDISNPDQPVDGHGVSTWMKNAVGLFSISNPEPFRQRVTGVGKTPCRNLDETIITASKLLADPEAPQLKPVLIEDTLD